jgi:5-methylcytosine-specific restriction protein A
VNHTFAGADDGLYVEVHHLQRLADGGPDVTENTAALCANHHREIHFGRSKAEITDQLRRKRLADNSQ